MFLEQMMETVLELGATFGVGLYVALSPCLFPLLPLFLISSLHSENSRPRSMLVTGVLVMGILSSLALFIALSRFIALTVIMYYSYIQGALGALVLILGILTLSHHLRDMIGISRLRLKSSPNTATSLLGVYAVGFVYSLLAAPCSGPSIIALIAIVSTETDIPVLIAMSLTLSMGVSLPYLAIALVTGEARERMASRLASSSNYLEKVVGLLLVVVGLCLMLPLFGP